MGIEAYRHHGASVVDRLPVIVGLALATLLSAGCVTNRLEMPHSQAESAARATQKGSVAFASARCFLYRRDNVRPPGFLEAFGAEMASDGSYARGLSCGRPSVVGPPPLLARTLILGETFGFGRDAAGRIIATAGEERIPLEEGRYAWEVMPLEYTQEQKTALFILELIASGFRGPVI